MKLLGRSSLSSVLGGFIYIAFIVGILAGLYILGSFFLVLIHRDDLSHYPMTVTFELSMTDYEPQALITFKDPDRIVLAPYKVIGEYQYMKITPFLAFAIFFGYFILLGLYFIVIIQMAHFFETLTRGDPFVRENGRRIKITGWCVIVGGLFHFFWKLGSYLYFEKIVVANGASLPGVRYLLRELHPVVILAGMIILVIAGIFQKGALLKEEQELTI